MPLLNHCGPQVRKPFHPEESLLHVGQLSLNIPHTFCSWSLAYSHFPQLLILTDSKVNDHLLPGWLYSLVNMFTVYCHGLSSNPVNHLVRPLYSLFQKAMSISITSSSEWSEDVKDLRFVLLASQQVNLTVSQILVEDITLLEYSLLCSAEAVSRA